MVLISVTLFWFFFCSDKLTRRFGNILPAGYSREFSPASYEADYELSNKRCFDHSLSSSDKVRFLCHVSIIVVVCPYKVLCANISILFCFLIYVCMYRRIWSQQGIESWMMHCFGFSEKRLMGMHADFKLLFLCTRVLSFLIFFSAVLTISSGYQVS